MPILKREHDIFPEDLLLPERPPDEGRDWWAVYTKARQEKAMARELYAQQVPFYLPLVTRTLMVRGRRVESLLPLFTGYIFLYIDDEERLKALKTNRTSQFIPAPAGEKLSAELRHVQRLIDSKAPLTVEHRLFPGTRVRVKSGPFMGVEGVVEEQRGKSRLIVEVAFLQQSVSVQIDELLVEPVG
jgi:transcriptional antiterminator RfaH